jgi:hypothetical protein
MFAGCHSDSYGKDRWKRRLAVINLGRFPTTFYKIPGGEGILVFLDQAKIEPWSEIKEWFFN